MQREESTTLTFFFAVNMCSILKNPANKRTKSSIPLTIRFILFAECSLCSICVRHFVPLLFLLVMRKVGCCSLVRSNIQSRQCNTKQARRITPVSAILPHHSKSTRQAKTNRNLSRFWRGVSEIARVVLYAVKRKRG